MVGSAEGMAWDVLPPSQCMAIYLLKVWEGGQQQLRTWHHFYNQVEQPWGFVTFSGALFSNLPGGLRRAGPLTVIWSEGLNPVGFRDFGGALESEQKLEMGWKGVLDGEEGLVLPYGGLGGILVLLELVLTTGGV